VQWTKCQNQIDPTRLVFIDETWTKTNMAPLRGWAPRGQRLKAKVPHGRWQTMTFIAAFEQHSSWSTSSVNSTNVCM
jgi:putative transposase